MRRIVKSFFVTSLILCLPMAMGAEIPKKALPVVAQSATQHASVLTTQFSGPFDKLLAKNAPQLHNYPLYVFITLDNQLNFANPDERLDFVRNIFGCMNANARTLRKHSVDVFLTITCDGNKDLFAICSQEIHAKYSYLPGVVIKLNETEIGLSRTRREQLTDHGVVTEMTKDTASGKRPYFVMLGNNCTPHNSFLLTLLLATVETQVNSGSISGLSAKCTLTLSSI